MVVKCTGLALKFNSWFDFSAPPSFILFSTFWGLGLSFFLLKTTKYLFANGRGWQAVLNGSVIRLCQYNIDLWVPQVNSLGLFFGNIWKEQKLFLFCLYKLNTIYHNIVTKQVHDTGNFYWDQIVEWKVVFMFSYFSYSIPCQWNVTEKILFQVLSKKNLINCLAFFC